MTSILSPALRLFLKDRWILGVFLPPFIISCVLLLVVLLFFPKQENVVLHYNVYFGIDLLGPWQNMLLIPIALMAITMFNAVAAAFIWRWDRLTSYILGLGTMIITTLGAVATGLLFYLNI